MVDNDSIENDDNVKDTDLVEEVVSESDDKKKSSIKDKERKSKGKAPDEKASRGNEIVPADQMLPNKLSIVPLQGRPIFPGIFTPLMISSQEDTKVVEQAYGSDGYIGILMLKTEVENPDIKDLCQVGTVAKIIKK